MYDNKRYMIWNDQMIKTPKKIIVVEYLAKTTKNLCHFALIDQNSKHEEQTYLCSFIHGSSDMLDSNKICKFISVIFIKKGKKQIQNDFLFLCLWFGFFPIGFWSRYRYGYTEQKHTQKPRINSNNKKCTYHFERINDIIESKWSQFNGFIVCVNSKLAEKPIKL